MATMQINLSVLGELVVRYIHCLAITCTLPGLELELTNNDNSCSSVVS